jgi:hypothetical protein
MISRKARFVWGIAAGLIGLVACLGAAWIHRLGKVRQHCIKITGIAFRMYSEDHGDALPFSTNDFGDALLLLVKEE